jgi:TolB-like protein
VSDVFLSYVREDRPLAEHLSHALENEGYSVWWDRYIRVGADFSAEIERELVNARVVIVVWSAQSLDSNWVRDEASVARDDNKLLPLLIDGVKPPLGFRQVQSLDMTGWVPGRTLPVFTELLAAIRHLLLPGPRGNLPPRPPIATPASGGKWHFRSWKGWSAAVASLTMLGLVTYLNTFEWRPEADSPRVIAVFPFSNLTSDTALDGVAAGVSDELRRRLGPVPGLRVISRESTESPTLFPLPFQDVADRLGIAFAVHGQLQRSAGEVAVQVRIETAAGNEQWSARFERDVDRLLELQSDVNVAVGNALVTHLTQEQQQLLRAQPTTNEKAWQLFRQANQWNDQWTPQRVKSAIAQFEQAIALDPNFARAYAGLAGAQLARTQTQYLPPKQAYAAAQRYVDQALKLDPNLSEAWSLVAKIREQSQLDASGALPLHLRAIELDPNSVLAQTFLTQYYGTVGEWEKAIEEAQRLQQLDPIGNFSNMLLSAQYLKAYVIERDPRFIDEGLRSIAEAKRLDSELWILNTLECLLLSMRGDFNGAVTAGRRAIADMNDAFEPHPCLATSLWQAGQTKEATEVLATLERQATEHYFHPTQLAYVHATFGNTDTALDLLEKAVEEQDWWLHEVAPYPAFDVLRHLPRFKAIYRKLKMKEPAALATSQVRT